MTCHMPTYANLLYQWSMKVICPAVHDFLVTFDSHMKTLVRWHNYFDFSYFFSLIFCILNYNCHWGKIFKCATGVCISFWLGSLGRSQVLLFLFLRLFPYIRSWVGTEWTYTYLLLYGQDEWLQPSRVFFCNTTRPQPGWTKPGHHKLIEKNSVFVLSRIHC